MNITSTNLTLYCASPALLRAQLTSTSALAACLNAVAPDDWPSSETTIQDEIHLEYLERDPQLAGWLTWFAILTATRQLVGTGGYKGKPENGVAELRLSVVPSCRNSGIATEMAIALTNWAFGQQGVSKITCRILATNRASRRLVTKAGFNEVSGPNEYGEFIYVIEPAALHARTKSAL